VHALLLCMRLTVHAGKAVCLPFELHLRIRCPGLQRVPGILKHVVAEERLGQLPLFAFGASSGGGFVLRLAQAMPEVQVRHIWEGYHYYMMRC